MTEQTPSDAPPRIVRDWRWALGVLGKTLITLGLLMLAFVGYQLWGTGIEFRASQNALGKDFQDAVRSASAPQPVSPDGSATGGGAVTPGPGTTGTGAAATTAPAAIVSTSTLPAGTLPAGTLPAGTLPAGTLPPATTVQPRAGDVIASLEMPTISQRTLYIVSGVRTSDLKRGIGHFPDTAAPGETGNAALAGHRTTYGAPFENLDRLQPGDPLIVETTVGDRYVYIVESSEIVTPEQVEVLSQPAGADDVLLTLTTCHPKRSTAKRLVVYSRLDPAQSSTPRDRGTGLPVGAAPTSTVSATTGPATTGPATSTSPATSAPAAPSSAAAATPTTTEPSTPAPGEDETEIAGGDELARGWFHDTAAWPHILLWGALLLAIARGGRWTGQRLGRRWLGPAVSAAPFVVVLYFVFQNISRLLPPGF